MTNISEAQKERLNRKANGGRNHLNPLKRSNSIQMERENGEQDAYQFYMFSLQNKVAKNHFSINKKKRTNTEISNDIAANKPK
jgi:hypothetical protein